MTELHTIQTFDNSFQACLQKARLEDAGIEAFLFDDNLLTVHPLYNHLLGGIKLKVRKNDIKEAKELLLPEHWFPLTAENGAVISCPSCGSEKIESGFRYARSLKARLGILLALATGTFPLYMDSCYFCANCRHHFRQNI